MCGFCDRKSGAWKTAYSRAGTWDGPPETSGNPLPDSSFPDSLRRLVFLDLKMLYSFAKRRVQFLQISRSGTCSKCPRFLSAIGASFLSADKDDVSLLLEMMVIGEDFLNGMSLHCVHRNAVRQAVLLILSGGI
jgi:hypothetical protein